MCGIAGVLEKEGLPVEEGRVRRMTALLSHRGPDDEGLYCRGAIGTRQYELPGCPIY